jgi:hypothetical protein
VKATSEEAPRQGEAVIGSPSANAHHVAGQHHDVEAVRPGADQDDVGEEEAQPDRILGGRRLGSECQRCGGLTDKPDRPTSDAQCLAVTSDLAPVGEDGAGAAAHADLHFALGFCCMLSTLRWRLKSPSARLLTLSAGARKKVAASYEAESAARLG